MNPGDQLFDLSGRVAIVTGSTKGIGRAMAEGLAASGASVVVSSRKQDACETVAAEIQEATGSRAIGIACHVGDWDAVGELIARVKDQLGRIDVLVNNAGINPARIGPADMTLDYWRKVFAVNVEGPLRTSQLAAPIMRDQGGGSIINIASLSSFVAFHEVAAYGASKAGVAALTRSLAVEFAPKNVRVNGIAPGIFPTDLNRELLFTTARGREEILRTPMARFGRLEEVAGAAVFLASDAASFVTGEILTVDGGYLASGVNQ